MKLIWLVLALSGLLLTLLPSIFVFKGMITPAENHRLMVIGLVFWLLGRFFYGAWSSVPGAR